MGRLTKARLAAKARMAARKNGILLAEPNRSSVSSSPDKSFPQIRAVSSVNGNSSPSIEDELKVHVIPTVPHECTQQPAEAVPEQNPRRTGKSLRCCEEASKTPKKRQPRRSPFDLWSDEVQRQMAADAKPRVGSAYKQLLKKWSRLPRIQKNYWKHRARLANEASKQKVDLEREKKEGRKAKANEKKDETMELMVELLPVKQEEETPSPETVVLVSGKFALGRNRHYDLQHFFEFFSKTNRICIVFQ